MVFCRFLQGSGWNVFAIAHVAQLAEHVLGKDEVISSSLIMGSSLGRTKTENQLKQEIAWQKKPFKELNLT